MGTQRAEGSQSTWEHTHISSSRCLQRVRDSTNCTPPAGPMPFAERLRERQVSDPQNPLRDSTPLQHHTHTPS